MLESIRPTADMFIIVIAERQNILFDRQPPGIAIGARRHRDKLVAAICAFYSCGYE
ncbi:hypothetical protein ACFL3Q_14475 [Planctomycetota bacterium]